VLVPAPFEGSVSYGGGTAAGPAAILEASHQVETHDDETGVSLEDLSFAVAPAVEPGGSDPAAYAARVEEAVAGVVQRGAVPFVLGGEHSVTIGAVRAVRRTHPKAHLLTIDAHADLRDSYDGSDHSHACVTRRLLDGGAATIVGVRSYSAEEARVAARDGRVRLVPARAVIRRRVDPADLVSSLGDPVYVSFDVDGLDPGVIPDTGTPEPGGLAWDDALDILRAVLARRRIVGMDVVELAPRPGSRVSDFAAARLVAKMLTYLPEMPMNGP
jgi:agmatinase